MPMWVSQITGVFLSLDLRRMTQCAVLEPVLEPVRCPLGWVAGWDSDWVAGQLVPQAVHQLQVGTLEAFLRCTAARSGVLNVQHCLLQGQVTRDPYGGLPAMFSCQVRGPRCPALPSPESGALKRKL